VNRICTFVAALCCIAITSPVHAQKSIEQCVKDAQAKGIAAAELGSFLRSCQGGASAPMPTPAATAPVGTRPVPESQTDPAVVKAMIDALDTEGVYKPIDPPTGGKFKGLFFPGDYQYAYDGRLKWPRVALTFVTAGKNLRCWTIDARIWTNETTSKKERFEICDAPVMLKDDFGRASQIDPRFERNVANGLKGIEITKHVLPNTTDSLRTEGPLPPYRPWFLVDTESSSRENALKHTFQEQFNKIMFRLAWVSGMSRREDAGIGVGMKARMKNDWRMWWVKFDKIDEGGETPQSGQSTGQSSESQGTTIKLDLKNIFGK
jgi:hypothetical protein